MIYILLNIYIIHIIHIYIIYTSSKEQEDLTITNRDI